MAVSTLGFLFAFYTSEQVLWKPKTRSTKGHRQKEPSIKGTGEEQLCMTKKAPGMKQLNAVRTSLPQTPSTEPGRSPDAHPVQFPLVPTTPHQSTVGEGSEGGQDFNSAIAKASSPRTMTLADGRGDSGGTVPPPWLGGEKVGGERHLPPPQQ